MTKVDGGDTEPMGMGDLMVVGGWTHRAKGQEGKGKRSVE